MDNKDMQGEKGQAVSENKGRGLFYAVIAVATFIIMAVGATFAYFTATTNSANSSVKTGSTTLKLKYISYESGWMKNDLIPADTEVTEYSFENQNDTTIKADDENSEEKQYTSLKNGLCKDDFGNSICSVYVFQVKNDANSPQTVSLNVVSETNQFASLNAMAYEVSLDSENQTDYDSTENNNGLTDPKFRTKDSDVADGLISVIDGDSKVLNLEGNASTEHPGVYSPIFINRKGVTKTLLKYIESQDTSAGISVKKPAIDRLLVPTVDSEGNEANLGTDDEDTTKKRTTKVSDDIEISGGETKTFALVLYIKNAKSDQTKTDASKDFTGRVVISSGDGSTGVSGSIGLVNEETKGNLQSQQ